MYFSPVLLLEKTMSRAQKEQQGRIIHDYISMVIIILVANESSSRVLDVGIRQTTARICGALIAIDRK